jgi:putative membrane protein
MSQSPTSTARIVLVSIKRFNMKFLITVAAGLLLAPVAASGQAIDDAQIAAVVVTANQVDIDAGQFAHARSTNDQVKAFAQLMVTDHTGVNKAATELVTRLKVSPQASPTSEALKSGGEKNLAHLKTLKGAAFDRAYIDHEFTYHQQVIDALDTVLIPGATNAELKALLVKVRPAFIAHRDHAKSLQSTMSEDR